MFWEELVELIVLVLFGVRAELLGIELALWFGEEKAGGQSAVRMWNLWQVTWFISFLQLCDLGHYLLPV